MDQQQKSGPALLDGRTTAEPKSAADREAERPTDQPESAARWLDLASRSYEASQNFVQANLKRDWEEAERAFQSEHPSGSKYHSEAYKFRSKLFRPRTRTAVRQAEAMAAQSFFANEDLVRIKPGNPEDRENVASAELAKELLQYRLATPGQNGVPWFLTAMGAFQTTRKYGFVVSEAMWRFETRKRRKTRPMRDAAGEPMRDAEGRPEFEEYDDTVIVKDRPEITVYDPENCFVSQAADWRDPINSSPFVQIRFPMYLHEIEDQIKNPDPKTGRPRFLDVDRGTLLSTGRIETWDSTRNAREGNREDSKDQDVGVAEYRPLWVMKNFMRWNGDDWYYLTVGTGALLTDPVPVSEAYPHLPEGERPLVMGYGIVEALKLFPDSHVKLLRGLQGEANDISNLRIDNWRLSITQRFKVKRGKRVDLRQVSRGAPGSSILMDDLDDVDTLDVRDVTGSAFREQQRVDLDFDGLAGQVNGGTVSANRSLNETVGGMEMMKGGADMVSEYDLRVFAETWMEPTLRHVVRLIQTFETDVTVIGIAAQKAKLWRRFGINEITDRLLMHDLTLRVNAGIGATDPMARLQKFQIGADVLGKLFPEGELKPFMDTREIVKEVFAPLGYRDGDRFFKFDQQDPHVQMLMQQLQALQDELDKRTQDQETKKIVAQINAYGRIVSEMARNNGILDAQQLEYIQSRDLLGMEQEHDRQTTRANNLHRFRETAVKAMQAHAAAKMRGQGAGRPPAH